MNTKNRKSLHVFLIYTPLQALIAKAIINSEKIENPVAFAIKDESTKVISYCQGIFNENVITLELHRGIFFSCTTRKIKKFINSLPSTHITLYTGSLKSVYSRYFINKKKENITINTFDDGLGNLVLNGYFSKNDKLAKRVFLSALGIRESYTSILQRINNHYTIYKEENVYEEYCKIKKFVSISTSTSINIKQENKITRILLTQPYSERGLSTLENELQSYKLVIKKFNITHVLPHPADTTRKLSQIGIEKIDSPYISEDIISYISQTRAIEVYAFGSSALINTSMMKNVKCHWLKNQFIPQPSLPFNPAEHIEIIELSDEKI